MAKPDLPKLNRPLVAVTLSYLAGIVFGWFGLDSPLLRLFLPGFLLLLLLMMGLIFQRRFPFFTVVLLLVAVATGLGSFMIAAGSPSQGLSGYYGYPLYVEGTVVEEPLCSEGNITYQIRVQGVKTREGRFPLYGDLLVKVYGEGQQPYWFGEKLQLRGVITEPRGRRNPGGFDYRFYLWARGIGGVMYLNPYQVISLGPGEVNSFVNSALILRTRLVAGIEAGLPTPHAELLSGILFGQRHLLPAGVEKNFRDGGVSHLLAVSGLHVGLVAALFIGFCRRVGIRGRFPSLAALFILFGYAYLTGMRPPALRAAVMISLASVAVLLDRERDLPTAISTAALLTLVLNPLQLFTAGFQLSYAATLAIIYLSPPLIDLGKRCKIPPFARSLTAVTLAAQLGVLPISALHFQHISLGALWFNLLLLPVMPLLVGLGLAAALLHLLSPLPAWPLFRGVHMLLEYILAVTGLARFAGFYLPVHTPSPFAWILYYFSSALLLVYYYRRFKAGRKWPAGRENRIFPVSADRCGGDSQQREFGSVLHRLFLKPQLIGLCLFLIALGGSLLLSGRSEERLRVTFIDVGQGASALVESGRGRILIDCGGEMKFPGGDPWKTGEEVLLPFLRYKGVRSLDLVVITHPHEDHFGGLKPLLGAVQVKTIWISPLPGSSPYYEEALEEAFCRRVPVEKVRAGEKWAGFGLTIEILGPPSRLYSGTGSDENNNSIVMRLLHPRATILFCGDIEQTAVQDLLRRRSSKLSAEVLLVPHHGGSLPDLPKLIRAVDPRVAVIQVGVNPFGHPHPSTLEALQQAGVLTFRNDRQGAVILDFNKNRVAVETMAGEKGIISNW